MSEHRGEDDEGAMRAKIKQRGRDSRAQFRSAEANREARKRIGFRSGVEAVFERGEFSPREAVD